MRGKGYRGDPALSIQQINASSALTLDVYVHIHASSRKAALIDKTSAHTIS